MSVLSYPQAIVLGALQGVTELFPISSLGHSVLLPAWLGGSWQSLVTEGDSDTGTPFLAFIVALHVATAIALLIFYARDWVAIIGAFVTTLRTRKIETSTQRLAWLIVVATIPVGVLGLLLEHPLRTLFANPLAASIFLTINGLILVAGEVLRRRATTAVELASTPAGPVAGQAGAHRTQPIRTEKALTTLGYVEATGIGAFQCLALLAGISRSGVTMVGGLLRGLSHEDAAKFAFLLATPVILAAGVLKLPTLAGPQGAGIHGQIVVGAVVAGVAAYLSVRFLTRYFATKTLIPFAVYCLVVGLASIIRFAG